MGNLKLKVAVIIASDTRSKGINKDETIPLLKQFIEESGWEMVDASIVPDERDLLREKMIYYADTMKVDLILTSGGTGPAKRDVTPEATKDVIEKELPGFSEAMRMGTFKTVKTAILSRGISGIRNDTLIINLPGNPRGAIESLFVIKEAIPHCIEIMQGKGGSNGHDTK
ncbi:MogA/MoaB family molybdenum cofactor biosynthesis protein [Caldisericum exile]|uniref:Molybdopterin biosynthesis protein n=1 Tax=Caldisericum exile (strain DSM 21853 / NBRC 104410 / AZM16c01) TaxID=511051 RepID=A0A7U6JG29_CALEA|nr:MogA/MoaB family molybdenum cofactor biosynthesis protein [Caldisericum exile]BAL81169.1 molybdopterin biosynthesis protein [Caldisericum exile AZM16c01]